MTCNPLILDTIRPDDGHTYEVWCRGCGYSRHVHSIQQARILRDRHREDNDDTAD